VSSMQAHRQMRLSRAASRHQSCELELKSSHLSQRLWSTS
jgi:hypothetical protein